MFTNSYDIFYININFPAFGRKFSFPDTLKFLNNKSRQPHGQTIEKEP